MTKIDSLILVKFFINYLIPSLVRHVMFYEEDYLSDSTEFHQISGVKLRKGIVCV